MNRNHSGISDVPTLLLNRFFQFLSPNHSNQPTSHPSIYPPQLPMPSMTFNRACIGVLISHCCVQWNYLYPALLATVPISHSLPDWSWKSAYSIRTFIITSENDQKGNRTGVDYNLPGRDSSAPGAASGD